VRLFLKDIGIYDDINCTGLLGLRRLIAAPCDHRDCNHASSFPVAFDWLFPQLQSDIKFTHPSIERGFAILIFAAMGYADTTALKRLVSSLESVNAFSVTKWFSMAHFIASRSADKAYHNSSSLLIRQGLDLHIMADEQYSGATEYQAIRGQTPTTIAMRYSLLWSNYTKLLRGCNMNVPNFVARELNSRVWENSGWTQHTLQALFELEFSPAPLPKISCESDDHILDPMVWSFGRERCWEDFLSKLRRPGSGFVNASELLRESRESLKEEDTREEYEMCYSCQVRQQREGFYGCEFEDSPFLFSI
jgi:hypothetical protein